MCKIHQSYGAAAGEALISEGVDLLEQWLGQVVIRQQPELEQRGGIGYRLARQVDAHDVAQRLTVSASTASLHHSCRQFGESPASAKRSDAI